MRPAGGWLVAVGIAISLPLVAAVAMSTREDNFVPITARGPTLQARVDSALKQVEARYPHVELAVRGLSSEGILIQPRWEAPDLDGSDFADELRERVEDQREATVAFFQALARADRSLQRFAASEDRLLVPIWSRKQILRAGDPRRYREFEKYSAFQFSARDMSGHAVLTEGLQRNQDG